ncbi:hypothetical protein PIB30_085441 [Stylosanthes scabra]|uniref:Aminotransferase-like plant mobile domain-containing protein n=1 Tax=Stylosanthes scabra TaxID=79078 RepID=A0ABU6ST38_9FABA|nr:hypothetical protein [Stylosanthes scabra]
MSVDSWFEEEEERVDYRDRLSAMEILVPKHLAENFLPEEEYPKFWRLIDVLPAFHGGYIYHHLYSRYHESGQDRDFWFRFKLGGREYEFTLQHLANVWGLENEEATFKSGSNPHRTWDDFDKLDVARFLNLGLAAGGKYPISRMSTTHRLLLYVVSYMLLPRKKNHGTAMEEDFPIIWAMAQEKQIKWPFLIAHKMVKYSRGLATASLGHTHLWTRIFKSLDFDLSKEPAIEPGKPNAISRKNINQMRCNLIGPAGEGEDVPPQFEAGTSSQAPPEAGAPPPVQPDYAELIQQGFQETRTMMSEGFAALSDSMDSLDICITSQSVDVQDLCSEFRSFRDSFQRPGDQGQQD